MAVDLARLVIRMEAQTAQLQSELEKANGKLDKFAKKADDAGKKAGLAIAAGVAAGVAALGAMILKSIDAGDAMNDLSVRLGVSVENLSRLQFAATRTGVASETLSNALRTMQKNISEVAETAGGRALPALNELNLSAKALTQLSADQQFLVLADAIAAVENPADRARLSMKLMGTEGAQLITTMEGGAAGIIELANRSDELGNTMSTKAAKAAAELDDTIKDFQGAMNGASQEIFKNLGPQLALLARYMSTALPQAASTATVVYKNTQIALIGLAEGVTRAYGHMLIASGKLQLAVRNDKRGEQTRKDGEAALKEADIFFELASKRFAEGKAQVDAALAGAPGLSAIIPDQVKGQNKPKEEQVAASAAAEKAAAKMIDVANKRAEAEERASMNAIAAAEVENIQIVNLQKEKFARLHEEALRARGLNDQLEAERFIAEQVGLESDLQRLRERHLATSEIEQQFRDAQLNAEQIHQANVLAIQEEAAQAKRDLMMAQLETVGNFFGTLGNLAKEGSKAQRILFAGEKAAALAQSLIALQVAIAKANSLGFPANIAAISQAVATGGAAISAIRGVNFGGARADGGPVQSGKTYLVGERGPEMFTPTGSGNITPNNEMGGVNVTIIENPQRAGTVEQDQNAVRIFVARVKSEIAADIGAGRGLAMNLQQTYGLRRQGSS